MLKTVICDDNLDLNYILAEYIKQINNPQIELVGTFCTGNSLLEFCKTEKIDLIILDILLPDINGIDLGKKILSILPDIWIVLLTASSEYSMKAFEIHAIDYILKPVTKERLKMSLEYISRKPRHSIYKPQESLKFSTKNNIYSISQGELIFAERVGRKTLLHTTDTTLEVYESLRNLESKLDKKTFIRTHNSYLVNKSAIFKIEKSKSGIGKVFLKDTDKIAYISRSHRADIDNDNEFFTIKTI